MHYELRKTMEASILEQKVFKNIFLQFLQKRYNTKHGLNELLWTFFGIYHVLAF